MIESKVALEPLQAESIHELVTTSSSPCLTLLLPPYRPAEQSGSHSAVLKTLLQDAVRQFQAKKIPEMVITDLLEPIRQLGSDAAFLKGSQSSRAIFRSPDLFREFELVEPAEASLTIGGCFEIRRLLGELAVPEYFYLLKITKKRVDLLRSKGLRAEPVELPKGTPSTLEAALSFKQPDHDLENRSSAGTSAAAMHGIRFGTGAERERAQAYLADFYKGVDRGIRELLHVGGPPLVLAGVEEDTALYRSVAAYPNILRESVPGSPAGGQPEVDLLRQAFTIARLNSSDQAAASLMELKERPAPGRFSVDLDMILKAAGEGRVHQLYLDENADKKGDLLNLAAVETIRHGGTAFTLPSSKMPDRSAAAAVFRY